MATKKKQKTSKIKFVALTCGYVESSRTSWLVYGTPFFGNPGYDSIKEAVTELALDLYAKWESERRRPIKKACCSKYVDQSEFEYCPKCREPLRENEFDPIGFMEFVSDLHGSTCDDYGEAEYFSRGNLARQARFWPWSWREFRDAEKDEIVWIAENAECVLLNALFDAHPEFREDDYEFGPDWANLDWKDKFSKNKQPSYR